MKQYFITIFISLLCIICSAQVKIESNNPLDVEFGDPFVLYDKAADTYFMYGTGGTENGFIAYSSKDLKDWKNEGVIYSNTQENAWGIRDFWAPEVYFYKGKYYLFYSAHWKENPNNELENFRIGYAVADLPLGPFKDVNPYPLFDPGYPIIDANVFFSEDGRVYLYYSRCCYKNPVQSEITTWAKSQNLYQEIEESWIYGLELSADLKHVISEPVLLLRPPLTMKDKQAEWESRSITSKEVNRRWTEGSFLFEKNGVYYLMYSANHFAGENYAVGYATSKNPLGPFIKANNNPILEKNTHKGGVVSGTGHNMVLKTKNGETYTVYHARTTKTGKNRVVFMDKIDISPTGELSVLGPSVKQNF